MSKNKNYVSETMFVSRIVAKGKVTDLTNGFKLKDGAPFSIYVRPKTLTTLDRDAIINCKLYKEDDFSECPVSLFTWVELVLIEIAPSEDLLGKYEIYWGSGDGAELITT
ncbi:hypothetical protein M2451_002650 [Dysgonomonas sp. PFB1-18]|uniref:hypothetical protein n=1 Tax=unclassified Dysgonomonas TaxID=2630389 RepID=UPI00247311BB|nr:MULTISPECIES: hypothetical protein [unclassified Dysgonomonas]MDH6308131.1 hypothetical protein [Dysgonomonas sp. PF1-14]MDH6339670.1 hypothetical protein [Dysgonomonas sp. PF1-16]MDH6381321.1 hypothetical protein [Dysgonomonas sp. PFB1-18]MDH6398533.1 hypothetical protein [Dysgonomonas sp. PF1-23]